MTTKGLLAMRGLTGALALLLPAAPPAAAADLSRSVVKLMVTYKKPNYYQPWDMGFTESLSGSGAILKGHRILTNAHVVTHQVYIQVLKPGDPKKYPAKVEFVSHDRELALVSVEDPAFFEGTVPVQFGGLPSQRDSVAAYGFPAGGDELSITEGVVSRIEVIRYEHSQRSLLAVQTDAAINPGNSGGPVFKGERMIGISFQSYSGSDVENTGYIVPMPVIETFLKDVSDGTSDGVPALGIYTQRMESDALKAFHGLGPEQTGVLVSRVLHGGSASGFLREGDVIARVAGLPVAGDETVPFRGTSRVNFAYAVTLRQVGETLDVEVLREGRPLTVWIPLKPPVGIVAGPQYDRRPEYLVYAGLLFVPLTYNYMHVWDDKDIDPKFRFYYHYDAPTPERRQMVIISQVLAHNVNVGYHQVVGAIVEKINGRPIGRLQDVEAALRSPQGGHHVIELHDYPFFGDRIVLDAALADKAQDEILQRYQITAPSHFEP